MSSAPTGAVRASTTEAEAAAPSGSSRASAVVRPAATVPADSRPPADDDAAPDDGDAAASVVSERELLERALGARVIEEIDHS
jgi:DNA polymerase-3 subunit gamma/tau